LISIFIAKTVKNSFTQGFEIGGSPVSIPQYMSSHRNKCVDGIIAELTRFEEFINIPVGSPKARLQLVYALIINNCAIISALLSHIPLPYLDIAIANTILDITNSKPYILRQ
jgi:hypothetical protein